METLTSTTAIGPIKWPISTSELIDIGCGNNKVPGAYGVDIHGFPGVDLVVDLNKTPWPLPSNSYKTLVVRHVIEHVDNIVGFMKELHRIAKPGATIYFETPHFSSLNSWGDPTHLRHLSSLWWSDFAGDGYLGAQTGRFNLIKSTVTFTKSFRSRMGAWRVKLFGISKWEKTHAFSNPASDIITILEVIK